MKKVFLIMAASLAFMLTACQSTKVNVQEPAAPDFSRNGGKTLDGYWSSYFETGDTYYLDQIIACADSEDLMIVKLNEAYAAQKIGNDVIECLGLDNSDGKLSSEYDLDSLTVTFLKYGNEEVSSEMKYVYSLFPQDLIIRNSVKTSAYWSLSSNASQHEDVAVYLKGRLKDLRPETRKNFADLWDITE